MKLTQTQLHLPIYTFNGISLEKSAKGEKNGRTANRLAPSDRAFHDWYRFVLSFPPHLVNSYIEDFGLDGRHVILDPFCGTGTTLVESKLHGIKAIGLESNIFAHFASSVKVDWNIDPELLKKKARHIANSALELLKAEGFDDSSLSKRHAKEGPLRDLDPEAASLLLTNSISPLPLHKTLILLDFLREHKEQPFYRHALLALANALVFRISNLHFGPEVGVGKPKMDVPVVASWLQEVDRIANDLKLVKGRAYPNTITYLGDARNVSDFIEPHSVDAVITSPPYPNEKDYTRTTRLESVILGFIKNKAELKEMKKSFIRSNTRGVYKGDEDDKYVEGHPEIQRIAESIERRRKELGKDSGFEKLYGRVTKLYFGGMARHLAELRSVLRPSAQLAYVVGDQASYLRIMIRTGQLLADIAEALGYKLVRIDLFRTRYATVTREQLREEVVVLRWPGKKR
ncbi:MAG: site-specific DNA-methyltransferase [Deltaproteobacteria bacterium]|nr:site-specific DNA-methyltransferase [Deltaproteobacteria bacterium]